MFTMQIEIIGGEQVQRKLKRLGEGLYDMGVPMRAIGLQLAKYFADEGFASQGGIFRQQWRSLADSTVKQKLRDYPQFVNVPLVASGTMKESFKASSNKSQVSITNAAPYFKYHQSSAPRTVLPRRQMMGINDPVRKIVHNAIKAEVQRKIRSA